MQASDVRIALGNVCTLWAAGDVPGLLPYFLDDVVFSVHARPNAPSMLGHGLSKVLFARRLAALLDEVEVLAFDLQDQSVVRDGIWYYSRAAYRYRHHASGMIIDGKMRHKWAFVGSKIAHFEIFHDADRMRAFFNMAGLVACGA